MYGTSLLSFTSYVTLRQFQLKFASVSTDKQSLQNWFSSHNESRKQSQDVMLYYHHPPLFHFFQLLSYTPLCPTQSEGPQEVWVKVHRAKSAKSCNSFVLCLHRAVHVCFHGLSRRTNQTVFRAYFSLWSSSDLLIQPLNSRFKFHLEWWDKPNMNYSKPHDKQQVLKGFLQQKHIKLSWHD